MATKLAIYNQALRHLKDEKIASLAEATERRYVLDDYYDDAILYLLRKKPWNFAIRTVTIDSSVSLDPAFGYQYAFEKPSDWVRTYKLSASETFAVPLTGNQIVDEAGVWYADIDPLYVQYVSSSVSYGADLSIWTPDFALCFTLYLAYRACPRVASSDQLKKDLLKEYRDELRAAGAYDAMDQPIGFPPRGSWVSSRQLAPSRTR